MIAYPRPLLAVFAGIPDVRSRRGIRHPLPSILALACCAMLCGARSYSAIAEWECNYGAHIARALGFRHTPRCAATLHRIFRRLDCAGFEAQLGAWAESIEASMPLGAGRPHAAEPAVALDSKTLRGSRKQGAPGVHLLSALSHHVGLTLAQQAVDDKSNEITHLETVLRQLVLQGRVLTMDALLT